MSLFDVDFKALVKYVLPVRLRGANMQAWLNALVSPVVYLYGLFYTNRTNNLYRLVHNGQVVYLQAALNDVFDATLRRITITDSIEYYPVFVYRAVELKPVPLYIGSENKPVTLYNAAEVNSTVNGFIVQVPTAITFNTAQMKALVNKYRLVSKNQYTIATI